MPLCSQRGGRFSPQKKSGTNGGTNCLMWSNLRSSALQNDPKKWSMASRRNRPRTAAETSAIFVGLSLGGAAGRGTGRHRFVLVAGQVMNPFGNPSLVRYCHHLTVLLDSFLIVEDAPARGLSQVESFDGIGHEAVTVGGFVVVSCNILQSF